MQAQVPELLDTNHASASGIDSVRREDEDERYAQARELEQLAERVSAARSVY